MLKATIVCDKSGVIHIRVSRDGPQTGGEVEVLEVLGQKEGEGPDAFKERAVEFVRTRVL